MNAIPPMWRKSFENIKRLNFDLARSIDMKNPIESIRNVNVDLKRRYSDVEINVDGYNINPNTVFKFLLDEQEDKLATLRKDILNLQLENLVKREANLPFEEYCETQNGQISPVTPREKRIAIGQSRKMYPFGYKKIL